MNKLTSFLLKYKIVILILILIASLFFIIFGDVNKNNLNASVVDYDKVNPYILITDGNAIIKRDKIIKITKGNKEDIFKGDKIRTLTKSTATIFWSDGSITRLGEKTSINITDLHFKKETSTSNIKFDIEGGKSWSNIVRYLDSKSSFTETYDNERLAATVRGTVFEINIDRNYVHAVDHSIVIKDNSNNKDYEIPEGKIRKGLGGLDFLTDKSLENAWVNWNRKEDFIYVNKLITDWRKKIGSSISDIKLKQSIDDLLDGKTDNLKEVKGILNNSFNSENKQELNRFFVNLYQNVNSMPNDSSTIMLKANLRNEIIDSAKEEDKQEYIKDFLRLNMYDYIDSVNNNFSSSEQKLKGYINSYTERTLDKEYIRSLLKNFDEDSLKKINTIFDKINGPVKDIIKEIQDSALHNSPMENIKAINDKVEKTKDAINEKVDNAKEIIINIFK
ncbi:MAG: FecR domain-containing protein [Candidatus Gracilibacteria bacterium]|nr:FecR domain-containing protein [Candidatus Gracilibacteria bacterium]